MHVTRLGAVALLLACGCSKRNAGVHLTCAPPECAYDTTLTLVAEVQPGALTGLVNQEFAALDLDKTTGDFQLALDPVATLSGTVTVGGGNSSAGSVVATRRSRIAGRPDVVYSTAIDPVSGRYTLPVSQNQPGESYTLRVVPADPTTVPPMARTLAVPGDREVDFALADPLTLPELHGTVQDALQEAVPGMQMQAVDPATQQVLSTTTTTDGNGSFSLRLVDSASLPASVILTATPPTGSALPTLTQQVTTSKLSSALDKLTVNLTFPSLPAAVHVSYVVQGLGASGATTPAVGAVCVFTADVTDPAANGGTNAHYSTTGMSGSDGSVVVQLLPSGTGTRSYDVAISPDASSNFQPLMTMVDVGTTNGYSGLTITLPLRPQLSGAVVDPSGKPIAGVTVAPSLTTLGEALAAQAYATQTAPAPSQADDDGRFAVRLNPGTWDLGIIPPPSAMLPRVWLTQKQIDASDVQLAAPAQIPMGVIARGAVTAGGVPVANADVRLYTVAASNDTCAADDADCLVPARLRAESISDDAGVVAFVLDSAPN